jgi:L-Ala-D/L-Glu epimerase
VPVTAREIRLQAEQKVFPLKRAFRISRGEKTEARVVHVTLERGGHEGRGEAVPYARYGETVEGVIVDIEAMAGAFGDGMDRAALMEAMAPGAARAAIDLALWDLEAKTAGEPVWKLAGLPEPAPVTCTETLALDAPGAMADAAKAAASPLLKLKLGGPEDMERLKAVHAAAPEAKLILDANEGLSPEDFRAMLKEAAGLGVVLIEQPFPAGKDDALKRFAAPVAICADESVHTLGDLDDLAQKYDAVNVKIDKAGGLTAALELVRGARAAGLHVMVGCMVGSSLSMAPAVLLAGLADAADLDGPLWLAEDIADGLKYENGNIHPPLPELWGG